MNSSHLACLCGLAGLALPAAAAADPSLRATPDHGLPGDDVTLHGRGWTNPFCENKVALSFRQNGRKLKLGSAQHGDGRFDFMTHYQQAEPGPARFVAVQTCAGDNKIRRAAHVNIGGDTSVRYRGQTEHGGRVSFTVIDGNEVIDFRFMNRCAADRERGSLVPGLDADRGRLVLPPGPAVLDLRPLPAERGGEGRRARADHRTATARR